MIFMVLIFAPLDERTVEHERGVTSVVLDSQNLTIARLQALNLPTLLG